MLLKIILNRIKNQKFFATLMIFNAIITAFICCFSYGVYQNYAQKIRDGEGKVVAINSLYSVADKYKDIKYADQYDMDDEFGSEFSSISAKSLIDTLMALPDETKNAIDYVNCQATMEDSVFQLNFYDFHFKPTNKGIVAANIDKNQFTDEEYLNGEKVVRVGSSLYTDKAINITPATVRWQSEGGRQISKNEKELSINNEKYKIIGNTNNDTSGFRIIIPFTSLASDTPIRTSADIVFYKNVTYKQVEDIKNAVAEIMPDKAEVGDVSFIKTIEKDYYKTIIGIALLMSLLSGINLAMLYTFYIENDKKRLSILRLCGCTKNRSIMLSLFEIVLLTTPFFILMQVLFQTIIIPKLAKQFPYMEEVFSIKIHIILFAFYLLISTIIMLILLQIKMKKNKIKEGLS